ncbi:hypothetical protein Ancab_027565 [Ancistrocladus abbreviatus]
MPVLRSREIPSLPNSPSARTPKKRSLEHSTPDKIHEPSTHESPPTATPTPVLESEPPVRRRKSLRLSSKPTDSVHSNDAAVNFSISGKKRRPDSVIGEEELQESRGKVEFDCDFIAIEEGGAPFDGLGSGSMGNGVRVSDGDEGERNCEEGKDWQLEENEEVEVLEKMEFEEAVSRRKRKGKRKCDHLLDSGGVNVDEFERENRYLSLRSGTRIAKRVWEERENGDSVQEGEGLGGDGNGEEVLIDDSEEDGGKKFDKDFGVNEMDLMKDSTRRKLTREEKGKGKLVSDELALNDNCLPDLELRLGIHVDLNVPVEAHPDVDQGSSMENANSDGVHLDVDRAPGGPRQEFNWRHAYFVERKNNMRDQFRDIARRNAVRFAHFNAQQEERNDVNSGAGREVPSEQGTEEIEDWPGPFSTAMKIVRDREKKGNDPAQNLSVNKSGVPSVKWTPRKEQSHEKQKHVPLLQDRCMEILAKNADAITSLEYIPDVIRHKLSQMLCDSRKMNGHVFNLLVQGSPAEIRLRDCSWLTEEQFTKSFKCCDTSNLMVLQLDQCGRCMADYTVAAAFAGKSLPVLTAISLKGACRLTDDGLSALVSSAPALRSINLSQCSLLSAAGIDAVADSLPILRELYLDDCQTLDVMCILPALKKLEHLEVLSLAGIHSVCDKFMTEFISSNGHIMKELILTNCIKLTDSSLKIIAETCSEIHVLDLVNLCKLTDFGIGYLANGCQAIQSLKLCRNTFSDEAIAAFLETSGESLRELSLNNVGKVGPHTAISLSRRCRNLKSLDVSWCRNLTDEALGLIADGCLSLRVLKLFGCTEITRKFFDGHSNPDLQFIGMKLTPVLKHIKEPDPQQGPLLYSAS